MAAVTVTPITDADQWHRLRAPNVGCSEVGALFGVHDYLTGYGLAARKLGRLPDTIDSAVLQRGRLLEPVARQLLAEQRQDWDQVAAGSYYCDSAARFGATPDLFVKTDRGIGVVQIKTVEPSVFARKWHGGEAGGIEPPLWIALQAMGEQHLTGANFAVIAALVVGYGLSLEIIEVPYLAPVIEQARARVKAFWELVDRGELPEPDYGKDRDNLARVLRQDDGTEIDLTADNELPAIAAELIAAQHAKHLAEASIDRCQARILNKVGTAQRALIAHGGVINAKTVHLKERTTTFKASSYRKIAVKYAGHDEVAA
jgi:YqaJ-like viral recombinase domain